VFRLFRHIFDSDNEEHTHSIYERRKRSAYGNLDEDLSLSKNKHILKWWSRDHDRLLSETIHQHQWVWYWYIVDEIVAITPEEIIEVWKKKDPLCSTYDWYNVLMYFARSRATRLGLTKTIRKPKWKHCPLCGRMFVEDSVPVPYIERLGIDQLDFCTPCLAICFNQSSGDSTLSKKRVLNYLTDLADVLQQVPPQNFGEGKDDFIDLSKEERLAIFKVLRRKPTTKRVKELFGSWLNALIQAGILEDGTRRTARGTQCLALDGHVCLSLAEKTIDDFLFKHSIPHEKEVAYPEGGFRADFSVNGIFIEYFGLKGDPEYDAKTRKKQRLCKKHGIELISLYPSDLTSLKKLENKISSVKR